MYAEHFGLVRRPFRSTLGDGAAWYASPGHELLLARLAESIADDEGLALVTGDPGTGKTLLCRRFLGRLGEDVNQVCLTNGRFADPTSFLQTILYDVSLPYEGKREQELRLVLTDFLLEQFAVGRRTVLVIDEAHHLSADLLEEVRLWGNLEADDARALQVVLAAQPQILEKLQGPSLVTLSQRLKIRLRLDPLTVEQSAGYLMHQMRVVGGARLLLDEAMDLLCRAGKGVPRLLNQLADQALRVACAAGAAAVDAEAVIEGIEILGFEIPVDCSERGLESLASRDRGAAAAGTSYTEPEGRQATRSDVAVPLVRVQKAVARGSNRRPA
jgi:type II secretory pathway predicted ATPase ExeA